MAKYETPGYIVIKKDGPNEFRKYESFYTTSVSEAKLAGNSAFGLLFSYITGDNKKKQKIQMTVPVINEFDDSSLSMEFVVPRDVVENEIPEPNNPKLKTKFYPEHYAAARIFNGLSSQGHVEKEKESLIQWLDDEKIQIAGKFRLARFNPPFSLPFLRHSEILVKIDMQE